MKEVGCRGTPVAVYVGQDALPARCLGETSIILLIITY